MTKAGLRKAFGSWQQFTTDTIAANLKAHRVTSKMLRYRYALIIRLWHVSPPTWLGNTGFAFARWLRCTGGSWSTALTGGPPPYSTVLKRHGTMLGEFKQVL